MQASARRKHCQNGVNPLIRGGDRLPSVTDDLPAHPTITQNELDAIEAYFDGSLDQLLGDDSVAPTDLARRGRFREP